MFHLAVNVKINSDKCFTHHEFGPRAKDCPNNSTKELVTYVSPGSRSSDKCFRCHEFGHWAKDCPNNSTQELVTYVSPGSKSSDKCFRCHEFGHWAKDCPTNCTQQEVLYVSPGEKSDKCFRCHEFGHWAKDCPNNSSQEQASHISLDSKSSDKCFRCPEYGHWANACPKNSTQEQVAHASLGSNCSDKCFRCHEFGHLANGCPNNSTGEQVPLFSPASDVVTPNMCSCRRKCRILISNASIKPCREYKCDQCMSFEWCEELEPSASQTPNRVEDYPNNSKQEQVPHLSLGNGSSDKCFECQQLGHWAKVCPSNSTQEVPRVSLGNGNSDKCYKCQQLGHWAQDCPNNSTQEQVPRSSLGKDLIPPKMCHCCRECRICISNTFSNPGRKFYRCNQCNFFEWRDAFKASASQNPNPNSQSQNLLPSLSSPSNNPNYSPNCPTLSPSTSAHEELVTHVSLGNGSSDKCFKCQQLGHWSKDCPNNPTQEKVPHFSLGKDVTPPKMCHCRRDCRILISNTSANPGRKFYKCNQCNYFEWCDASKVSASQNPNPNFQSQNPNPSLRSPSNNPNHSPNCPTQSPGTSAHEEFGLRQRFASLGCKSSDQCFKCNEFGHWAKDCPNNSTQKQVHDSLGNDVIPPKMCHCHRECRILISNTSKNPGRKFYRCNQCNFFEWCDNFKGSTSQNLNPSSHSRNPNPSLSSPSITLTIALTLPCETPTLALKKNLNWSNNFASLGCSGRIEWSYKSSILCEIEGRSCQVLTAQTDGNKASRFLRI